MPRKRNAKSVDVDAFTGSLFFTITIFHLAYPQKFCRRSIVFKFSRKDCKSQEKVETMLMQNVFFWGGGGGGGANKVYYGHLKAANFLHLTSKNIHNTTRWKSAQTSYCRSIFQCNTGYTETLLRKNSFPQYPSVQLFYYLTNFVIFRPQFFVRLVYRFGQTSPEILKIPGCDTFCPLEKFIE